MEELLWAATITKKGDTYEWEILKKGVWIRKGVATSEYQAKKEIREGLEVLK